MAKMRSDYLLRLSKARKALHNVDEAAPSIDEIARAAALSRFYFVRQFKSLFGVTPVEYRTRARIERAKDLLISSEHSVTDICASVGFSSLGSFSALFSARVGQSPTGYRRAHQKMAAPKSPACMQLLQAMWAHKAQNSRSASTSNPAKMP